MDSPSPPPLPFFETTMSAKDFTAIKGLQLRVSVEYAKDMCLEFKIFLNGNGKLIFIFIFSIQMKKSVATWAWRPLSKPMTLKSSMLASPWMRVWRPQMTVIWSTMPREPYGVSKKTQS